MIPFLAATQVDSSPRESAVLPAEPQEAEVTTTQPAASTKRRPGIGLRLGMIEAHYPRPTGTFFQREIDGLAASDVDVHTFVLHAYDPDAWADPAVHALTGGQPPDRTRVHYSAFFWSGKLLRANAHALLRKPVRYLRTLGTLLRHLSRRPLVSLKMLALFPKAVFFAAEADRLQVEHLCAFWANHCATVAFVMTQLMDRPVRFTSYAHAGTDLYRDQSFLRQKLQAAAAIFPVSDFNRRWLTERYPEVAPKIMVHHLGLDLDRYAYDPTPRREPTVVAAGGLELAKGFHILIEACALLRDRGVAFRCEILGEGPQRPDLEARIRRHALEPIVSLPGQRPHPEVIAKLRAASLLVHPSVGLGDGVPTVIKEAAALGTPVVGTRAVGIPELVADGETGILVEPDDPAALAEAMARLLSDPRLADRMAQAGRARAERMFDLYANTARLADRMRQIVSHSGEQEHGRG